MSKSLLVTGSSGLIGSAVCEYFHDAGWNVHGVDNNQRAIFFGAGGDTRWNQQRMLRELSRFRHHELDLRDRAGVLSLLSEICPDAIVHAAAQPSHDLAARIPFDDFDTNAVGTLNMLEAVRQACPESPFVLMSTNKVYGDGPNQLPLTEQAMRWEYGDEHFQRGIPETFSIDHCKHSLFGASKVAADVLTQEYGRYFGMPTCCLRGGCLTGPNHSGVALHGFLSFLIRCNLQRQVYTVYGYGGKQVRDNIHALDVARFIDCFVKRPRCGEVYNIGGGFENTCSILEAFQLIEQISGVPQAFQYVAENRIGDHICYYSDLSRMKTHYPEWDITIKLPEIFRQIHDSWIRRNVV
jgi:CDP-paratose 2-epimerase